MEVKEENPSSSPMESSDPISDVQPTSSTVNTALQPVLPIISPLVQLEKPMKTNEEEAAAESKHESHALTEESKHESFTERQLKRRRLMKANEEEEAASEESKQVMQKLSLLSDAPLEALSNVAGRLGLNDILNFRGACKAFWYASDRFIGKLSNCWFLQYSESTCIFLTPRGKIYRQHLPHLEGATCLASSQGWLLMVNEGLMFFFAPLSGRRIDLHRFPQSHLNEAIGTFSSHPTSERWKVAVLHKKGYNVGELNVLECGSSQWRTQRFEISLHYPRKDLMLFLATPCGGFCYKDVGYFFDTVGVISYSFESKVVRFHTFIPSSSLTRNMIDPQGVIESLPFNRRHGEIEKVKQQLEWNNIPTIKTCGTATRDEDDIPMVILNETISKKTNLLYGCFVRAGAGAGASRPVKGVWFTPESSTPTQ